MSNHNHSAFQHKTVWVTGASSGIGEGLAYTLAKKGARVILSARRLDELERVKVNCEHSERHHCVELDLAHSDRFKSLVEQVINEYGPIDILINNAGLSQRSKVLETKLAVHRQLMEINYFGTVQLTQCLLPHLLERQQGGVITVSSLVGKFTTPQRSAYAASKHAITAYMDSLRAEPHGQGVQFTTIYPGFIKTNLTYKALLADGSEQNKMDDAQAHGMSPEVCAEKILKAWQKGRAEAYVGGKETYGIYLKRFFPRLFARIVRTAKVT
ncbi:SDR family oxidoreductase [Kangiella sp.]|uniref:SDR family oxidoreductase n=1 Tax=Kangiella sp. TaxID=1920245 RepID=UPI003A8D5CF5